MQLAVISDIHGNYKALETVLAYLEERQVDAVLGLGDYVTDAPDPERILSMLSRMEKRWHCDWIRGNREQYLIENHYAPKGFRPSSANGMLYYVAQHIKEKDIRFFESLPITEKISYINLPVLRACHGAPKDLRGNVVEEPGLKEKLLKELEEPYLLGGHSHHQERDTLFGKTYINPGSLGLAIDGRGGHAQFAILHGREDVWEAELISLPYDLNTYLREFQDSEIADLGGVLARAVRKTLCTGENFFYMAVVEAGKRAGCPTDRVSEEIWEEVAGELEL